ncbi:FMN-binding negative transcriptional regulator [Granulicella tundricola]|uniref:FMN-binding negative transcriptional regulator n=1 Tax=Granulicella tundricola (strain ATCC BAA-1859 / DSM 23138 / MP5ACTX9) TaxID=1198114 RepID=E8X6P2_GRATM|nr:FMN-binding negative transcriptional regulator [Granulicella tundricola]ADW71192.1 FMN-binding negative transcriptional regulator [Granulicella tundricola MP5ACTX9]
MYTPKTNAEEDLPTLRKFVRDNPLCALVTGGAKGMVASHIPMVLHEEAGGFGVLRGHVARANPQWKEFAAGEEALGIFTGPQHYISASWYPEKLTHGREVPTWNYVAVHAYGPLRAVEDPAWLLEHLRTLTDENEVIAAVPWKVADAPTEFIAKLCGGIVGLEMQVVRVEGKWKVSQNRNERDAAGVMEGLDGLGTAEAKVMRELVEARRPLV